MGQRIEVHGQGVPRGQEEKEGLGVWHADIYANREITGIGATGF